LYTIKKYTVYIPGTVYIQNSIRPTLFIITILH